MEKELSFWEHLEELRRMLFRIAVVLAALMVIIFCFKSFVFDTIILSPRSSNFVLYRWLCELGKQLSWDGLCRESFVIELTSIELSAQFTAHLSMSFWGALIIGFPYLVWELWKFIAPALYKQEKRRVRQAFFFSSLLFYIGIAVAYFIIFPFSLHFFGTYQVSEEIYKNFTLESYISLLMSLLLSFGIVFEFPVLVHILSNIGIISRDFLQKYRRHALFILTIVSAIITPPDLFSLLLTTIPLYLLFEISILTCKKAPHGEN